MPNCAPIGSTAMSRPWACGVVKAANVRLSADPSDWARVYLGGKQQLASTLASRFDGFGGRAVCALGMKWFDMGCH